MFEQLTTMARAALVAGAEMLAAVPDVVWSGIVASILTLSGVFLSDRGHTKRLKEQLEHDARERLNERLVSLRRETYLNAATAAVQANTLLGAISDPEEAPKLDVTTLSSATAQVMLVGEPRTVVLANQFAMAFFDAYLSLSASARPVHTAIKRVASQQKYLSRVEANIDRVMAEMYRINETPNAPMEAFPVLQSALDSHVAYRTRLGDELSAAETAADARRLEFARALVDQVGPLTEMLTELLLEIRRDLGVSGEVAGLIESVRANNQRMRDWVAERPGDGNLPAPDSEQAPTTP